MLENLPSHYRDPNKAPVRFCLQCGEGVSFQENSKRWGCDCGYVHHDYPQPVANALVVIDPVKAIDQKLQKSDGIIRPSNSQVLAIQRGIPPFKGQWALAGFL